MAKNTDDKFSGLEQECNAAKLLPSDLPPCCEDLADITHTYLKKDERGKLFDHRPTMQTHTHSTYTYTYVKRKGRTIIVHSVSFLFMNPIIQLSNEIPQQKYSICRHTQIY